MIGKDSGSIRNWISFSFVVPDRLLPSAIPMKTGADLLYLNFGASNG
jgi:hypothetical protein